MRYASKDLYKDLEKPRDYGDVKVNNIMSVVQSVPFKDPDTGRLSMIQQVVDYDFSYEMSKYKVEDFYLENMIADGTIGQLQMCGMSLSSLNGVDNVISQLGNVDKYLETHISSDTDTE